MCGICGFAGRGGLEDLKRMQEALFHRGPDDEGIWIDDMKGLFLGHRRLSIIDLEHGRQPMWSADGAVCVIFNGEIYNHEELRDLLEARGHNFRTDHSDTEVLINAYREWGKNFPEKLNGMWAFAIYDRESGELFLSRDRFGKKPLYYTLQNKTFAFASELSSLVRHKEIRASISKTSLQKYFAYGYVPSPLSLYRDVYKLPGGYNLTLDVTRQDYIVKRYWDFVLEPFEAVPTNAEEEWGENIRALLSKSVKRRLVADVPLGVFLSGGMDSSSIAAYAAGPGGKDRIKSFSIGFEEPSFDESIFSNRAAAFVGTEHHLEVLSLEKAKGLLSEIVSRLDEPMGDSSMVPTYLLCRETRKHVTVALGGDGADELFAGYDPFRALKAAALYARMIPRPVHKGIRMLAARLPVSFRNMSLDFRVKRTLRGLSYPKKFWIPVWLGPLSPAETEELFDEPIELEALFSEALEQWEACDQEDMIDKTLQFYTKLYLQDDILVKTDRASMMHSLEVRAPFLDIDFVDFIRKIPGRYKFRNGQTKYILKKALQPLLPREILYRDKKGFAVPMGMWFKKRQLTFDSGDSRDFLNVLFIKKVIAEHQKGFHDHRAFLWNQWLLDQYSNSRASVH